MMHRDEPEILDFDLPGLRMRALAWGPPDGRLAICVHGFPDSAHGWRRFAPLLAARGYRVVAPFTRGYSPSALPSDGDYTIGALMSDVLDLHRHLGSPSDAVLIGHDWGAWTTNAISAWPESPFAHHVSLALSPVRAFDRSPRETLGRPGRGARQLRMSWYILFFQLPTIPQRVLPAVIRRLWRDWSPPGTDVEQGTRDAIDALPTAAHRAAAVSYYRCLVRVTKPAPRHAALHRYRFAMPAHPLLVLHGELDGAMQAAYARSLRLPLLAPGSHVEIIEGAGHFLQLDQPEKVLEAVLDHIGRPADRAADQTTT